MQYNHTNVSLICSDTLSSKIREVYMNVNSNVFYSLQCSNNTTVLFTEVETQGKINKLINTIDEPQQKILESEKKGGK